MQSQLAWFSFACWLSGASGQIASPPEKIALSVPAGTPLRLYLTHRVSKRSGAAVEAKLLEPLYVFDRQVAPAGAKVMGRVSRVEGVSKSERTRALLNGDFTPLHRAYVEFTELQMPDGRTIPLHTMESTGLDSLVPRNPAKAKQPAAQNSGGVVAASKRQIEDQIHAQIDRVKSIPDIVRGPDKKELAEDYLMSKLPYHPQYVRNGTRFDAELRDPLDFGSADVTRDSLALLGSQPPAESVAHARLLTPLDSHDSKQGQRVQAMLVQPIFSADHKLILPEGTRLDGSVVVVKKARSFHRGGQLRFTFQGLQLPDQALEFLAKARANDAAGQPAKPKELQVRTEATLKAAESGSAPLKVDGEGGVQAKESKTRFIGTAVAVLVARRAGDNDPIRAKGTNTVIGQQQNVAGRTLGGGFGFGLIGAGIAQSSRTVGAAFGYYGLAWVLYSTVIARGAEVQFNRDAAVDIGFNARTAVAAK